MALLNWILLIALVILLVAHEQPATSFTNGVLEFTNSTCARVLSSWDTLRMNAQAVDGRFYALEKQAFDYVSTALERGGATAAFNQLAEALRPSRWSPPDLYGAFLNRMCH